jgi:alpha-L-fucosidase
MPGHHGDYYSSEYQDADGIGAGHPWEESRGMGRSYGFNRAENLEHYRTSKELVRELIDVVSRGGNLLLNVGPTADGRIPVIMQQRLRDIGSWLAVNGEAIYGTRPWLDGSAQTGDSGAAAPVLYTRSGTTLYAHFLEWPEGDIRIDGLAPDDRVSVSLLGFARPIAWHVEGQSVIIEPPLMSPSEMPSPYSYVFRIDAVLE